MNPTETNPPALRELQSWMRRALTRSPEPIAPDHSGIVVDGEPMTRARRLAVYADAYFWRLVECLQNDFPALYRAAGEEPFPALIDDFLRAHPSRTFTVADVGRQLPEFLRGREPAYLADFAALDRAFSEAFYADDRPELDRERLATMTPEDWADARFGLDSSVRLVDTDWRIEDGWHAREEWSTEDYATKVAKEPQWFLVYRRDDDVWIEDVGRPASLLLRGMAAGKPLSVLLEEVALTCELSAEEGQAVFAERFGQWMENGVIREILT